MFENNYEQENKETQENIVHDENHIDLDDAEFNKDLFGDFFNNNKE